MAKICAQELIFETTRRCNMACPHCLRGETQNMEITDEVIDRTLDHIEDIGTIVFTGGEPALNPDAMMYTLEACKKREIPVYSFFLATNGKEVSDAFIEAVNAWYRYYLQCTWDFGIQGGDRMIAGEELMKLMSFIDRDRKEAGDGFSIALSADRYHEYIPYKNVQILMGLPWFSTSKSVDFTKYSVIDEGRARNLENQNKHEKPTSEFYLCENGDGSYQVEMVYVNAEGTILADCDLSYDHQADKSIPHFSVFDPDWAESLIRKYAEGDEDAEDNKEASAA